MELELSMCSLIALHLIPCRFSPSIRGQLCTRRINRGLPKQCHILNEKFMHSWFIYVAIRRNLFNGGIITWLRMTMYQSTITLIMAIIAAVWSTPSVAPFSGETSDYLLIIVFQCFTRDKCLPLDSARLGIPGRNVGRNRCPQKKNMEHTAVP